MMINKFIKWLLPLLLLSCSDLIEPLNNLPDGYGRVTVSNYSDITISIAFDDGSYADADKGFENDQVVSLAGFSSKFFDVKIPNKERKVWLKIPADTVPLEMLLKEGDTKEFSTGLESIYKRRIRLKFYNYDLGFQYMSILSPDGAGVLIGNKNYLNEGSALFETGTSKIILARATIEGVPQVTNVDLIVSGSDSEFGFTSTGTIDSFGNDAGALSSTLSGTRSRKTTFSIGPDEANEYEYYSKMKCRFNLDSVIPPVVTPPRSYDEIAYTFVPVSGGGRKYIGRIRVLDRGIQRLRSTGSLESYSPTVRFEYDVIVDQYSGGVKTGTSHRLSDNSPLLVCERGSSEEIVATYDGTNNFVIASSTP